MAQKLCVKNGSGIIIHMPEHDGRGWGEYKLSNQKIMGELNLDTVTAARMFYGDDNSTDLRTYNEAAIILRSLGLGLDHCFDLATNNPQKIDAFKKLGMNVVSSSSVIGEHLNSTAIRNLRSKSKNWNHSLSGIQIYG
jgi:GTP cyclohydrolase II